MKYFSLDLFSSEFYFNLEGSHYKKGTIQGVVLTLASITLIISYFVYLLNQYLNNLIDPLYRSQSFINSNKIELKLTNDLVGFQYYYNNSLSAQQYEAQQNKTYLVYYPLFYYQDTINNVYQIINLTVIQCTTPELQGYNCIDFSPISNKTLLRHKSDGVMSQLQINVYGCLDLDSFKTTIPSNCASQNEIDDLINGDQAGLSIQLKTQQYNTTSMQIQTNYRTFNTFGYSNQFIINSLRTQMQETQVKKGLIIQGQEYYSSPIQYDQTMFNFDRKFSLQTGFGPYNQITILMDEIVQQIQIQYPTITQILALVNSISFIIIICRIIGRFLSQKLIKEDFFTLIMSNLFQDKCQQILQHNNLMSKNQILLQIQSQQEVEIVDEIQPQQERSNLLLPNFQSQILQKRQNSKCYFDNQNSFQNYKLNLDDVKEFKDEIKMSSPASVNSIFNQNFKSKNYIYTPKTDKQDLRKKNTVVTQSIESNIKIVQKKESFSKQPVQKPPDLPKSNLKDQLKTQEKKIDKSFVNTISQKLQILKSSGMKKYIQSTLFKFKCFKFSEYLKSKGVEKKHMDKMHQEVQRNLNINELYKDLIFLKKAVSMLLSVDQMAAIELVGLTDNFINLDLKSDYNRIRYDQDKKKLNHFERQYSIYQSEDLQIDQIEKFLIKCQENQDLDEVDKRIFSSITKIKNQMNYF